MLCGGISRNAETGREHFIIYKEGYRDNRVELALFDIDGEDELLIEGNILSAKNEAEYKNDVKYYLDGNKWTKFEEGYEHVSNNAAELIESDIDVKNIYGQVRLYGQNEDGSLKDFPELSKDLDNLTLSTVSTDTDTWKMLGKCDRIGTKRGSSEWLHIVGGRYEYGKTNAPMQTGHFIDIENDPYPDEQLLYSFGDGYAVLPTYSKEVMDYLANKSEFMPQVTRSEDYEKIYITDLDFNIKEVIRADTNVFSSSSWGYFICVDSLAKIGDEYFASYRVMNKSSATDFNAYRIAVIGMYRVADGKVYSSPKYETLMSPDGKMVFADVRGGDDSTYHNTYALLNGKKYRVLSKDVEYRRSLGKMFGDYFFLPNISSAAEIRQPKNFPGDPGNHNVGMIRELYFSKDYVNFARLDLKAEHEDSGITTVTGASLDDQYYIFYNSGFISGVEERPVQIFSKKMIADMVEMLPDPVYVAYRDMLLSFDTPPQIIDGSTMIPVRLLFETMGAGVSWDDSAKTATIKKDGTEIKITAGNDTALVNGEEKTMDVGAKIIDGRTLVPLRFLSESLGYTVTWNDEYRLATIDN